MRTLEMGKWREMSPNVRGISRMNRIPAIKAVGVTSRKGRRSESGIGLSKNYQRLDAQISKWIERGRSAAVREINPILAATCWLMERNIVISGQGGEHRAGYGNAVIAQFAKELAGRFGRGFSRSNLLMMRSFYLQNPVHKIIPTASGKFTMQQEEIPLSEPAGVNLFDLAGPCFTREPRFQNAKTLCCQRPVRSRTLLRSEDEVKDSYIPVFGADFTFVARQKRFAVDGAGLWIDLILFYRVLRAL